MIFYTKLKKLKNLNKRSFLRPSFTLIELIIVIIIIGILAYSLTFKFAPNNIQAAADKLINDLRYTQSLALKDDKYYPYPENNSSIEQNRSKYWFKQWWQIRLSRQRNDPKYYYYSIFSDSANSSNIFDTNTSTKEYAISPLSVKYKAGDYNSSTSEKPILKGVKLIRVYTLQTPNPFGVTNLSSNNSIHIIFDNFGNIFAKEGLPGDSGDINPIDKNNRPLLVKDFYLQLCADKPCVTSKERCVQINITPSGYIFKSNCQ